MTLSGGFGRDDAYSVFEAMRPAAGAAVDRIAAATYSLDLVAVTALLLSLGGAGEEELEAGPLSLIDALRTVGSRLTILHQKGRLQAAPRHYDVLHMLDGALHAVRPGPGASWHPKFILARYLAPGQPAGWRLWIGSRNLTGSQDRDAGLVLCGSPGRRERGRLPAVAAMARAMIGPARWDEGLFAELERVAWQTPAGVRVRDIHWRRPGERKPFFVPLARASRTLALSPFADPGGLAAVRHKGHDTRLLTIPPTAADLHGQRGVQIHVARSPIWDEPIALPASGSVDDEQQATPADPHRGLHAKLILQRAAGRNRLWIGSANLTGRGLNGPNAEIMAELEVAEEIADALERFHDVHPPSEAVAPTAEAVAEKAAQRALDDLVDEILALDFELFQRDGGLYLKVGAGLDAALANCRLESWLFTLPDSAVEWPLGSSEVCLSATPVPLRLQTVLVGFRAASRAGPPVSRTWAQQVGFPGFDAAARDHAATAAYIGPGKFQKWLRARLEGILPAEPTTWTGAARGGGPPAESAGPALASFALEEVLAAWARNPGVFEARVRELSDLMTAFRAEMEAADSDVGREALRELAAIEPFWNAVRQCVLGGTGDAA
jgi:hypothetical protein